MNDVTEEEIMDLFEEDMEEDSSLLDWVLDKRDSWRDDYSSNYEQAHEEYYRLWRAQWSQADSQRLTERSRIIAPALQQAVESSVSELEEATFGRGKWFDIHDDLGDNEGPVVEQLKNKLMEDFNAQKIRKDVSECLINAAVFGNGIAELVLEEVDEIRPATREIMDGEALAYGVETSSRAVVRLRPIMPKNFLIEPVATSIEESVGVIIDEFVPRHQVEILQDKGVYNEGDLEDAPSDLNLEPDEELAVFPEDRVRLTKYYGLVPKELLPLEEGDEEDNQGRYTEGVIIIANDGLVLKAQRSPYMMKDRPVVSFPWDIVPNRFWGRGVCEKGYMSQKALDTELRARIDALGLIVHPMLAMDATKMPRGFKPEVRPGKVILTNGPPGEALQPFNFGTLDTNTFTQSQALQSMVQQATGAIDSTGLLSSVSGDTKAGAVSMSLGAVIKRHKRTLINFQDAFLIPFIKKAAWRYMQFDPENYPVKDWQFTPSSTLGIIAREYEVSQLISLLQTMSPESPLYPALIQSVVENMNLSNREELVNTLVQASQPSPEEQQAQQEMLELQKRKALAEIALFENNAQKEASHGKKYNAEAEAVPMDTMANLIRSAMGDLQNQEEGQDFDRRLQILDRMIKDKDLEIRREVEMAKVASGQPTAASQGGEVPQAPQVPQGPEDFTDDRRGLRGPMPMGRRL